MTETRPEGQAAPARRNWFARSLAVIATLAIIVIAAGVWLQWRTLHRMQRFLLASQRPWVAAAVEPVQLVFDDKGGGITLKMTLKNGGPIPATDVLSAPILLLGDAKEPYRKACGNYGVGGGIGPTLFKDETVEKTSTAWLARKDFGKGFPHLVALCIKYRFGNSRRHAETGYLFSIGHRDASGNVQYITDSKNGSLKPPELVLMPLGSYQGRLRRDWRPPR